MKQGYIWRTKNTDPELKISEEDLNPLLVRLESNALTQGDKQLIKKTFYALLWLQAKYRRGG